MLCVTPCPCHFLRVSKTGATHRQAHQGHHPAPVPWTVVNPLSVPGPVRDVLTADKSEVHKQRGKDKEHAEQCLQRPPLPPAE